MGNQVLAFPAKPTPEQIQMGAMLATNFKPEDTKNEWCVAIQLKLERADVLDRKAPDWNGKTVSLQIGTESLHYTLDKSDSMNRIKTTKIGTLTP